MKVKVTQSCLTLCHPMDYTVHEILQARILEWVAFPFSGDLPNPGIKPRSPALQVDSLPAEPQLPTGYEIAPSSVVPVPCSSFPISEVICLLTSLNHLFMFIDWFLKCFLSPLKWGHWDFILLFFLLFIDVLKWLVLTCGEGDGTPLQYSCLENPMDGGAW